MDRASGLYGPSLDQGSNPILSCNLQSSSLTIRPPRPPKKTLKGKNSPPIDKVYIQPRPAYQVDKSEVEPIGKLIINVYKLRQIAQRVRVLDRFILSFFEDLLNQEREFRGKSGNLHLPSSLNEK